MPLIDLNSLSGEQLKQEARYWAIEPSDYKNDKELIAAVESQRKMRGASHPITQQDIDSGQAKAPKTAEVPKDKDPKVVDSKEHSTISRPTPGEPETRNKQADKANKRLKEQDNSYKTQKAK